jgi:hypothetical protein
MITIVSVSGGLSSAEALRRCVEEYGRENVVAVFADVKGDGHEHWFHPAGRHVARLLHERYGGEAPDLYRFLWRLAYVTGVPIERLEHEDRKTIWSHIMDKRAFRLYSGGFFYVPCSERGKRERIARWIEDHYEPGEYQIALGMDWSEDSRVRNSQVYWRRRLGWDVEVFSPLAWKPYADNCTISAWAHRSGLTMPEAYTLGMEHNNCNGGCVAAGQTQFYLLWQYRHLVFAYWRDMEAAIRAQGVDATILKDERGGSARPMTLAEFEQRLERGDVAKRDTTPCMCYISPGAADFLSQAPLKAA